MKKCLFFLLANHLIAASESYEIHPVGNMQVPFYSRYSVKFHPNGSVKTGVLWGSASVLMKNDLEVRDYSLMEWAFNPEGKTTAFRSIQGSLPQLSYLRLPEKRLISHVRVESSPYEVHKNSVVKSFSQGLACGNPCLSRRREFPDQTAAGLCCFSGPIELHSNGVIKKGALQSWLDQLEGGPGNWNDPSGHYVLTRKGTKHWASVGTLIEFDREGYFVSFYK